MKNRDTQFAIRVDVGMEERTDKLELGGAHRIIFRNLEFSLGEKEKRENKRVRSCNTDKGTFQAQNRVGE